MQVGEAFVIGQCGGDEEDGVGAVGSGFVDLGFVDGEILTEEGKYCVLRIA